MDMYGLTLSECMAVQGDLESRLPNVPRDLLATLASNFRRDAGADVDPSDLVQVLGLPGRREVLRGVAGATDTGGSLWLALMNSDADARTLLSDAAGAFLYAVGSRLTMKDYGAIYNHLVVALPPGALNALAWYTDATELSLTLIVTGIGCASRVTLSGAAAGFVAPPQHQTDLPSFLRNETSEAEMSLTGLPHLAESPLSY